MATKINKKILVPVLLALLFVSVPVLAQETAGTAEEQIVSALRYAFGVPSGAPDALLWARFAFFLLFLIVISALTTTVPMFKEKRELGALVAGIIAYIGTRFIPDDILLILIVFMPVLCIFGYLGLVYQYLTKKEITGGWEITPLILAAILGTTGMVMIRMRAMMEESFGDVVRTGAAAAVWPWWAALAYIFIIGAVFLVGLMIWGWSKRGFGLRNLAMGLRMHETVEKLARRDLATLKTEEELENEEKGLSNSLIGYLGNAMRHINARDFNGAKIALMNAQKEIQLKIKISNEELTKAKTLLSDLKREYADLRGKGLSTDKIDGLIRETETAIGRYEDYIERLENKLKQLEIAEEQHIVRALEFLQKNESSYAIVEIEKAEVIIKEIG
ncbi:MAG: hypothetical protein ACP5O8_04415, partial [Candidatus Aenigmatarchaeota archaeon]